MTISKTSTAPCWTETAPSGKCNGFLKVRAFLNVFFSSNGTLSRSPRNKSINPITYLMEGTGTMKKSKFYLPDGPVENSFDKGCSKVNMKKIENGKSEFKYFFLLYFSMSILSLCRNSFAITEIFIFIFRHKTCLNPSYKKKHNIRENIVSRFNKITEISK